MNATNSTSSIIPIKPFESRKVGYGNSVDNRYSFFVRVSIIFYVLSVAIENMSARFIPLPTSLTTISGLFLLATFMLSFSVKPRRLPLSFTLFMMFFIVTAASEIVRVVISGAGENYIESSTMYIKLAVIFFILNNMIRQNIRIFRLIVLTWSIAMCLLAFFAVLHVDLFSYNYYGRIGVVGENLNIAGHRWAGLAVCMIAICFKKRSKPMTTMLLLPFIVVLSVATFNSGSRGATVSLIIGIAVLLIMSLNLRSFFRFAFIAFLILIPIYLSLMGSNLLLTRFGSTIDDPSSTPRIQLLIASMHLILNSPIVGYGSEYDILLGDTMGTWQIVSHNTITQVLLTCGILSGIPFLFGLFIAMKNALKYIQYKWGFVIFAALLTSLISCSFGNWAHLKYFWLVILIGINSQPISQYLEVDSFEKSRQLSAKRVRRKRNR